MTFCRAAIVVGILAVWNAPREPDVRGVLASRAADLERELLPGVRNADDFAKIRPALREEYFDMLGLRPLPEKTPLEAKVTGRLDQPGYSVEKLHFQSKPGLYVTANLYLPSPAAGRHPAILYLAGHYRKQKRDGAKSECQEHGIWFATHGYVCLIPDTLELGEIAAVHQGTCPGPIHPKRWWWHSAGYTPAAVECWNAVRALDYLETRPEVDSDRIGATGISGGGGATFWISAADDRIKAAAPVSGMGDLGFYVGESGLDQHCDCMFLYNRARWNWTTLAVLAAPRPLLFVNSDRDQIFPMSSNERIINRLERFYARLGAGDRVGAMISMGRHDYRTDIRRGVYEFFNRHLKGDARAVDDPDAGFSADGRHRIEYRLLRVFPEDHDLPADQKNTRIDESFVPAAKLDAPSREGFDAWKRNLLAQLRKTCFAAWPAAPPSAGTEALGKDPAEGRDSAEDGFVLRWRWAPGTGSGRWLIVLDAEEELGEIPAWAREMLADGSALLVSPRGCGRSGWGKGISPDTVARSLTLLGTTVDAGRIWDILTVARRHPGPWKVAGRGAAGILAAYAALFEPLIEGATLVDPPASHRPGPGGGAFGPALLGVLQVLDIPDALGCLAPRPLALVHADDPTFRRTDALYQAAGGQLERR
jgi:dienelactone hydrolase